MRLDEYLPPCLIQFLLGKAGVSYYEYALLASIVAAVIVIALLALGKG